MAGCGRKKLRVNVNESKESVVIRESASGVDF